MTRALHKQEGYPVTAICQVLEVPRSTVYYEARPKDEQALRDAVEAMASQFPTYGSRRMSKQAVATGASRHAGQSQAGAADHARNGAARARETAQGAHHRQSA